MILSAHQPIFLPWPGLFYKALKSDCLVLLDDVQFPQGRSWMARNRLKSDQGELWITTPVRGRHGGKRPIRSVEIAYDLPWQQKHIRGITQHYKHSPYLHDILPAVEAIYEKGHRYLADFNIDLIRCMLKQFNIRTRLLCMSELRLSKKGSSLLTEICTIAGADTYLTLRDAEKHLDAAAFISGGIKILAAAFSPPIYPQLWGPYLYNLSALDMLLNCGPKSRSLLGDDLQANV